MFAIAVLTRSQGTRYSVGLMNKGDDSAPIADDADVSSLLSLELELAPAWAKKAPEVHQQRYADDPRGGADRDSRRSPHRGNDRAGGSRDRRPPPRGGAPAGDFRREGGGRPDRGAPRPGRSAARPDGLYSDVRREFRPAREELPPLPLEIRVLPDQKALGAIIRKIQTSHRAYPLRDIARLFLDNDAAYQIRIEPAKGQALPFFQCKVCNLPALTEEEIRTHVLSTHLADFFDSSEIETEPPAGNFVCVARCGISGELLGPPNHHSFNTRVQEMLRTRFAHMSPEAYRARIEMVRDPEIVNQWRESCRKKTVYRRKRPQTMATPVAETTAPVADAAAPIAPETAPPEGAAETEMPLGPPMERAAAEVVFQREILPEQIQLVKQMVCTAAVIRRTPSHRLLEAVRETMNRELQFPASLFFALRGAFRHRSLHLFRANNDRGPEFVVVREPATLDATHVVAELRQVLEYINQHPGCTRPDLLTALANGDETLLAHLATQLNTLVEKAHVIEFYNGILCPPAEHPAFRHLPGERDGQKQAARKTENGKRKPEGGGQTSVVGETKTEDLSPKPEMDAPTAVEAGEPAATEVTEQPSAAAETPATTCASEAADTPSAPT